MTLTKPSKSGRSCPPIWRETMRRLVSTAALFLSIGFAPLALAQTDPYVPTLGDIMSAAQWRHIKLWFAGKHQNWELASYELLQIRAGLEQAATLYHGIPVDYVGATVHRSKRWARRSKPKTERASSRDSMRSPPPAMPVTKGLAGDLSSFRFRRSPPSATSRLLHPRVRSHKPSVNAPSAPAATPIIDVKPRLSGDIGQ